MNLNEFIIGSNLDLAIASNVHCKQMHVYVKDSMYFASYSNPTEFAAMSIDISEWKVIPIIISAHWLSNAHGFTPKKMIEQIVTSFNVVSRSVADNTKLRRIYGNHPDLPKEKQMDIPARADVTTFAENMESMNQAFKRTPEAEIALGKHWYANNFKAIIEHAKAHNDSIVYSYAKGDKQFLSFFSDLGDVSKNGVLVATWLPGWVRRAWNTAESTFAKNIRQHFPHIGMTINSVIGLLADVTLSGTTHPVPIQGNSVATDIAAGKVVEALTKMTNTNVFGMGGMPMTAENAPPTTEELKEAGYFAQPPHHEPSLKINNSGISGMPLYTEEAKRFFAGVRDISFAQFCRGNTVALSARTSPNKSMGETEISQMYPKTLSGFNISTDVIKERIKQLVKERKETQMNQEQFRQSFTQFVDVFTTDFPKTDITAALKKMLIEKGVASFMEQNKGKATPVVEETNMASFMNLTSVPFAVREDKNGKAVLMSFDGDTATDVTSSKWTSFNHPVFSVIREYLNRQCNLGLTVLPGSDNIVFTSPHSVVIESLNKAQKEKEVTDKTDNPKGITFRGDPSGAAVLQLVKPLFDGSHAVTDATFHDFTESSPTKNTHIDLTKHYLETTFNYTLDLDRFTGKVMVFKQCPVNGRAPVSYHEMVANMLNPTEAAKPVETDNPMEQATDGGVNEHPEQDVKQPLPQVSALVKLLDPLGDDAGIIDLAILHSKIAMDPSLADKEYHLYTYKGMHFISDRDTVGDIFNADGDCVGNMLSDVTCMSMLGSELARQFINSNFDTEIEDIEDLMYSMF